MRTHQPDLRESKDGPGNPPIVCADCRKCQLDTEECPHDGSQRGERAPHCTVPRCRRCQTCLCRLQRSRERAVVTRLPVSEFLRGLHRRKQRKAAHTWKFIRYELSSAKRYGYVTCTTQSHKAAHVHILNSISLLLEDFIPGRADITSTVATLAEAHRHQDNRINHLVL